MSAIPSTCKAAVLEKAKAGLVVKQVPVKPPKEGEILLKVKACSVCGGDVAIGNGHFGDKLFPRVPGHEMIGTIAAVGPGEKRWKVGQTVGAGWHGGHCAECRQCQRARYNLCPSHEINGITRDGGYAEYCTLRREVVVELPKDMDPTETAPLMCAGLTLFNGIRRQNILSGDIIVISGVGGLGHLGLQYASKMGYKTVAISSSASKRDLAMELGASAYIDGSKEDPVQALQEMGGAALIIETSGNPETMSKLLGGLAPGGQLQILTVVGDLPLNTMLMVSKGLAVQGWHSGHQMDTHETASFAQTHGIRSIVEKFPLDKANEAFKAADEGKVRFRSVIMME